MLTILSLFDVSGVWASAFELFGCSVWQVDLKLGDDVRGWSAQSLLRQLEGIESIDGVIGAPPCTAFARSGARAWAAKDGDGRTQAAVELVRQQLRVVDLFRPRFWAAENPVGRIDRLVPELGTATLAFDPCDFAGWTTSDADARALEQLRPYAGSLTADQLELVRRTGAYMKRTLLWGRFATPLRRRIAPVRCTAQGSWTQAIGGNRESTKAERSVTPEGFALAFAAAQVGASPEVLMSIRDRLCRARAAGEARRGARWPSLN